MLEIRRFVSRLITFFRAGKADSELAREINAHLQLLQDQFVSKGMSPQEARYAAKRAFGGVEQTKEHQRDTRSFRWLAGWSMDLKLGVRMLGKTPGLTIIAVIALAVGIGTAASYFEFVNDLFRAKLSFPGAERLVGLLNWNLAKGDVEDRSLYEFAAWKMQLTTVEGLGAARQIEEDLITENGRSQAARGWEISASAFRVVPIPPLYGRPLLDDDENPGATDVVVIGEDLWKARFNSDPLVIGRTVRFGETRRTVVGVMPHGFGFPVSSSLWTPLRLDPATIKRGEGPLIRMFGRLAPGVGLDQAQAELESVAGRMEKGRADATAGMRPSIHPYVESFWTDFSRNALNTVLLLVYSSNILAIALLGICAANVATLVFARTTTRENEITIRTALGASRGRIVAQLFAEALVLASIAAIVGLAGASTALQKAGEMLVGASSLPFWWNEQLGIETIAYSVVLVIIAALLIGGVPALKATGPQMSARLKEAGAGGATMRLGKLWTGVIVAQVAVTVIFLLVLVSFSWIAYSQSRRSAEVAFPRNEYLVGTVRLEEGATAEREMAVRRELQRRLNEDSEVINSTFAVDLPGGVNANEFRIELPSTSEERGAIGVHRAVPIGSNYFETFQQPLVAGRRFTASEIEEGRNVAIVDETFVRLVLGGKSAIGQRVRQSRTERSDKPRPWQEIVGVVKDITVAPNKTTADAMLYRPSPPDDNGWRIVVHSRSNAAAARLRAAATATDPQIRLIGVTTIDRNEETEAQGRSFIMTALGIVAAVTLMLAAAGIYSLISFTLTSRTREIGIRTALGAAPLRIVTGILSPTFMKVAIGIVLGSIPGTALVSATLDWGINFRMIIVATGCVALFIIAVAMISCIWPVRRALRIQPTDALRTT